MRRIVLFTLIFFLALTHLTAPAAASGTLSIFEFQTIHLASEARSISDPIHASSTVKKVLPLKYRGASYETVVELPKHVKEHGENHHATVTKANCTDKATKGKKLRERIKTSVQRTGQVLQWVEIVFSIVSSAAGLGGGFFVAPGC